MKFTAKFNIPFDRTSHYITRQLFSHFLNAVVESGQFPGLELLRNRLLDEISNVSTVEQLASFQSLMKQHYLPTPASDSSETSLDHIFSARNFRFKVKFPASLVIFRRENK